MAIIGFNINIFIIFNITKKKLLIFDTTHVSKRKIPRRENTTDWRIA